MEKTTIRKEKSFEMAVPFSDLGYSPGQEVWFQVYVQLKEQLLAWYPRDGLISFKVPDKDFQSFRILIECKIKPQNKAFFLTKYKFLCIYFLV
jgi:hypothetical protein